MPIPANRNGFRAELVRSDASLLATDSQTDTTRRFEADAAATAALAHTKKLSEVSTADFDAIFYPGGHGPLWDLSQDPHSIVLIEKAIRSGKPVGLVCHAPGVLRDVKGVHGKPLVDGKAVTGFSNSEEEAVGLTKVVPFLVEDMLKSKGGRYSKGADWQSHVQKDGLLVTGQNPASSNATAHALLDLLA
jgi:putative intracellular protease/amidase